MALLLFITKAEYRGGLSLKLHFDDGTEPVIDFASSFTRHPHPQYNKYKNPEKSRKFNIEGGNIVWGKNRDMIFPIDRLHSGQI